MLADRNSPILDSTQTELAAVEPDQAQPEGLEGGQICASVTSRSSSEAVQVVAAASAWLFGPPKITVFAENQK